MKQRKEEVVLAKGDRVEKLGLKFLGTILNISPFGWVKIQWDLGQAPKVRPLFCTNKEIRKV